jgi:hypothetical protein
MGTEPASVSSSSDNLGSISVKKKRKHELINLKILWSMVAVKVSVKVKVKLSPCFNWAPRHEGVVGEWRYNSTHSLTSALDGGEWSGSRPGRFTPRERTPGTHWIGGWVGTRAVLDAVVRRKISSPRQEWNPRTPIIQLVAQRYTDWAMTAQSMVAVNILNKQSWTVDKGWSSSMEIGRGANNSSP